jgi:hypothetical protein
LATTSPELTPSAVSCAWTAIGRFADPEANVPVAWIAKVEEELAPSVLSCQVTVPPLAEFEKVAEVPDPALTLTTVRGDGSVTLTTPLATLVTPMF